MKKMKNSFRSGLNLCLFIIIMPAMAEEEKGLSCYECGTGVPTEPDCNDFRLSPVWIPFKKECGSNMVCVKMLNYANMEVRGCTPKKSLFGSEHEDGCYTHKSTGAIFCYCRQDLCNHVNESKQNNRLFVFSVIIFPLIRLIAL